MTEKLITLVVDTETKKVGCVLLQAGYGGDNHFVSEVFHTRHWLLAPTENMGMVRGTREQWRKHAEWLDRTYPR